MQKKIIVLIVVIFLFFYILNFLTPLSFGDDYVYSFIWQGQSEYEPLSEDAVRISSLRDLFVSQWSHYFTWSGRTVNHTLAQVFLWAGKDVFNFFNAFISVLLIVEIYWCAHKGKITWGFKTGVFCWIFFTLWAFTPGFSPVFFWLDGACNYLWTAVLLLGFMLPYIRKYYSNDTLVMDSIWLKYGMFLLGLIAGWTNENSICWILVLLSLFVYTSSKQQVLENWMITGLAGLAFGYMLLMGSPGNVARLHAEVGAGSQWLNRKLLIENLCMLGMVFLFQFLLWYFNLRTLFLLKHKQNANNYLCKDILLAKILCLLSFCMSVMMLFSPNFPPRSAFPGTVQLIIAFVILLRIQEEYGIKLIQDSAQKLLLCASLIYFIITSATSVYGFYLVHAQMQEFLLKVKNYAQTNETVLTVSDLNEVISSTVYHASGLHIISYKLSDDEKNWRNVAFARYYGIKGIRMVKDAEQSEKE